MNCGIAAHETIRRYCNEKIRQRKERKMSVLEFIKVVILGIVEGITEWLPISSTGHMILVDEFIKMEMTPEFKEFFLVVIQLGAILAVVVLYWSKLWPFYIREISPKKRKELNRMNPVSRMALTFVEKFCNKDKWILWFKILVACIPTIVIALPFNDIIEEKFNNYVVVAIALIVYGVIFIQDWYLSGTFCYSWNITFRLHDHRRNPRGNFKNSSSRVYLFPGNSGHVWRKSSETCKIWFRIYTGRDFDTGDRRCCCIFCIRDRNQVPDGLYQET